MPFDPELPFNDLPDLPPAGELETLAVLKQLVRSRSALASLAESIALLPNAELLTNSIVLQEAKDSSEIENIITTHDELYRSIALESNLFETAATKEVKRYREALRVGLTLLKQRGVVNTPLITAINATLLGYDAGVRRTPGTKLLNTRTREVIYTPPEGPAILQNKLDSLWSYLESASAEHVDPLIRLALMHYQFEAIHPYIDGNGRTGRILNVLYLVHTGLLPLPILYMSGYIIGTKSTYYDLLNQITSRGNWEAWILYILEVIERTANASRELVGKIRTLQQRTMEQIREHIPRLKMVHEITNILFSQPYSRIEAYVNAGIGNRKTVSAYLRELESAKIIESRKIGTNTLYINVPLFDLLSLEEQREL